MNLIKKTLKPLLTAINFFAPKKIEKPLMGQEVSAEVVAIIPTFKPTNVTYSLVSSLLVSSIFEANKKIKVIVVDDCSPDTPQYRKRFARIRNLAQSNKDVVLIRTSKNKKKAAAINFALKYIRTNRIACDAVLVLDDDVTIEENTAGRLIDFLFSNDHFGAVTSLASVRNKNKNFLTRLQGLEYYNFNIEKIADNGFFSGPLVMQGMLTAFRYRAIKQVGGFSSSNLIEDYEITARLKKRGWIVGICQQASAATDVPENFSSLWRQRVRWNYWGLYVLADYKWFIPSVIQDLIGHFIFISLTLLIITSFAIQTLEIHPLIVDLLILLAIEQFLLSFTFSLTTLFWYRDIDWKDLLLRLSIVPELVYSTILSLIVYGSYSFYLYNKILKSVTRRLPRLRIIYDQGLRVYDRFGYSLGWGTR